MRTGWGTKGGAARIAPCFLILATCLLLNLPIIKSKPETFDQVKVFSVDEYGICMGARFLVETRGFTDRGDPNTAGPGGANKTCSTRPYGQLYSLLIAVPLIAAQALVTVDEAMVIRWAVLVLVISAIVVLWMTYAIAARLYGQWYGVLAATLVMLTPEFLRWSNEIHPDMPQLAALMVGFYFVVRTYEADDRRRRLLYAGLASACAGVAMAAKFNGVFLLPAVVAAYNRGIIGDGSRASLLRFLYCNAGYGIICAVVFVAAFALCSPCLVANPDLAFEPFSRSASMSLGKATDGLPIYERLLGILSSNRVLAELTIGYGAYVLLLLAMGHMLWRMLNDRTEELRSPRILAEIYIVPFLTYSLVLGYGLTDGRLPAGYERYLLPVVPAMYISGLRIVAAVGRLQSRYRLGAVVTVVLALFAAQAPGIQRLASQHTAFRLRREMGFFKVHDWVLQNIPKGATIYTESYIYVPREDYFVLQEYAVNSLKLMRACDYVITKTLDYDLYSSPQRWQLYKDKRGMAQSRRIYQFLEQGRLPGFERVALLSANGPSGGHDAVAVYRNIAPARGPGTSE